MDFYALLDQVVDLLRSRGRVSYGALKRQFGLDDAYLEDLKVELIDAQHLARDENGSILVWAGDCRPASAAAPTAPPALQPARRSLRGRQTPRSLRHPPRQRRNAASSPCCSATWWTRPPSPVSSIQKTCARWCGPIKTPARR